MVAAGVVPSAATERELAEAFSASPGFAAAVLDEAQQLRRAAAAYSAAAPQARPVERVRWTCLLLFQPAADTTVGVGPA
jgi:hypothetical protein